MPRSWRAQSGGVDASKAKRLREQESGSAEPRHLLAEPHLEIHALKCALGVEH